MSNNCILQCHSHPFIILRQFESYNILQINEIDDTTIVGSDNKKKEQKK